MNLDIGFKEVALAALVALPGCTTLLFGFLWMLGWMPPERLIARWTQMICALMVVLAAGLGRVLFQSDTAQLELDLGHWLWIGASHFELSLVMDKLSWALVQLTTILLGTIAVFSARYVHRDRGFFRFFMLMNVFGMGALLVFLAGSFDLIVAGWELVGLTSVLLIAFFDERVQPVRSALSVFAVYRISGIGLLLGIFLLHSELGTANLRELFHGAWPNQTAALTVVNGHQLFELPTLMTIICLLLLLAAAGKSAQLPFMGWLPKAMEGPTPSSAIFYGSISVHLGAYLLLRIQPWLEMSPIACWTIVAIGAVTAFLATLSHRVSPDVKTSLAFAAMAQLGIIFVEIGLGFPKFALAHLIGHAVARTLQFLRAPSMLHDHHRVHAASGGHLAATGEHYNSFVPRGLQLWLYRLGLERGFYDALTERCFVNPVLGLGRLLAKLEPGAAASASAEKQPKKQGTWDKQLENES